MTWLRKGWNWFMDGSTAGQAETAPAADPHYPEHAWVWADGDYFDAVVIYREWKAYQQAEDDGSGARAYAFGYHEGQKAERAAFVPVNRKWCLYHRGDTAFCHNPLDCELVDLGYMRSTS